MSENLYEDDEESNGSRRAVHEIKEHINRWGNELKELIMVATQADIDAITAGVSDIDTKVADLTSTITADDSALAAEITRLQGQGVDVTALQAVQADLGSKVSDLTTAVAATTALVPAPTSSTDTSGGAAPTGATGIGTAPPEAGGPAQG